MLKTPRYRALAEEMYPEDANCSHLEQDSFDSGRESALPISSINWFR